MFRANFRLLTKPSLGKCTNYKKAQGNKDPVAPVLAAEALSCLARCYGCVLVCNAGAG